MTMVTMALEIQPGRSEQMSTPLFKSDIAGHHQFRGKKIFSGFMFHFYGFMFHHAIGPLSACC